MITAAIFPVGPMSDESVDQIVVTALRAGLVACNAMTGPFRIAFFPPGRVPKGWARFGCIHKKPELPSCAA